MNKTILMGRLIADPELKFLAGNGTAVTSFTLAVDKGLNKDKKAEFEAQGKPTADFIRCKSWGKRGETIAQYFTKGSQILVEGAINTGSYTKDDGSKVYTTDINVQNFHFTASAKKEQSSDFSAVEDYDPSDSSIPF